MSVSVCDVCCTISFLWFYIFHAGMHEIHIHHCAFYCCCYYHLKCQRKKKWNKDQQKKIKLKISSSIKRKRERERTTKIKSCLEYINFVFVFLWICFKMLFIYVPFSFSISFIRSFTSSFTLSYAVFFRQFSLARVLYAFTSSEKKNASKMKTFFVQSFLLHCLLRKENQQQQIIDGYAKYKNAY